MAEINRSANAVWNGDSRNGKGKVSTDSGALKDVTYTWKMRFENEPGTNPEELIAAAEAACFSMALASQLAKEGHPPEELQTHATLVMESKEGGGWRLARIKLDTKGKVPGINDQQFKQVALSAKTTCPVSVLLMPGLDAIDLNATLE